MPPTNISPWSELDLVYLTGKLRIADKSDEYDDRATRAANFANLPEEISIFMYLDGDAKL